MACRRATSGFPPQNPIPNHGRMNKRFKMGNLHAQAAFPLYLSQVTFNDPNLNQIMSKSANTGTGKKYVAIAGNIGAGKSSLTRLLSQHFKWEAFFERVEDNPYLADFYADMRRWSFNLQVFFLSSRFNQQQVIENLPHSVVQDRSIYEDAKIFARNLHEMGLMTQRDFENYTELFAIMTSYLRPPDLLVYLRASVPVLVQHIQSRGRAFESNISIDYLNRLNELYEDWINEYTAGPKLIINVDSLDFVNEEEGRAEVINQIEGRLYGLFS